MSRLNHRKSSLSKHHPVLKSASTKEVMKKMGLNNREALIKKVLREKVELEWAELTTDVLGTAEVKKLQEMRMSPEDTETL